jgi:hypothetical protein
VLLGVELTRARSNLGTLDRDFRNTARFPASCISQQRVSPLAVEQTSRHYTKNTHDLEKALLCTVDATRAGGHCSASVGCVAAGVWQCYPIYNAQISLVGVYITF